MASKQVTDIAKHAQDIVATLRAQGGAIGEGADATLGGDIRKHGGSTALLHALAGTLEQRVAALLAADAAHVHELSDDEVHRTRRDEAASTLNGALVTVKAAVSALYGRAWVARLALPVENPYDPARLERAAAEAITALKGAKLPKPSAPGVKSVDVDAWISHLETPRAALAEALKSVRREDAEALGTQRAKDAAMASLLDATVATADVLRGLARLAGRPELAAYVRGTPATPGAAEDAAPDPTPAPQPE